ncbi:hypothetical protein ACFPRL_22115 [Pseudoclavibacter helvolus]
MGCRREQLRAEHHRVASRLASPPGVARHCTARHGTARRGAALLSAARPSVSGWVPHFQMGCNPSRDEEPIPRLGVDARTLGANARRRRLGADARRRVLSPGCSARAGRRPSQPTRWA